MMRYTNRRLLYFTNTKFSPLLSTLSVISIATYLTSTLI